jgi:hypothetical protein
VQQLRVVVRGCVGGRCGVNAMIRSRRAHKIVNWELWNAQKSSWRAARCRAAVLSPAGGYAAASTAAPAWCTSHNHAPYTQNYSSTHLCSVKVRKYGFCILTARERVVGVLGIDVNPGLLAACGVTGAQTMNQNE